MKRAEQNTWRTLKGLPPIPHPLKVLEQTAVSFGIVIFAVWLML